MIIQALTKGTGNFQSSTTDHTTLCISPSPYPTVRACCIFCFLLATICAQFLGAGLLLLLLPQSGETDTGDLDDLETDTGNITLGLTLTTETGKENLVVLIDEVQATVIGD